MTTFRIRHDDDQAWWFVLDPVLILSTVLITAMGAVLVYSATRGPATELQPADTSFLQRQVVFAVLGLGVAAGAALIDVRRLRRWIPVTYLGLIILLAGVLMTSIRHRASHPHYRWGA